jgi:hypothetical protein
MSKTTYHGVRLAFLIDREPLRCDLRLLDPISSFPSMLTFSFSLSHHSTFLLALDGFSFPFPLTLPRTFASLPNVLVQPRFPSYTSSLKYFSLHLLIASFVACLSAGHAQD